MDVADPTFWTTSVIGFTIGTIGPYKGALLLNTFPEIILGIVSHPHALVRNGLARWQARSAKEQQGKEDDELTLANNRIMAMADPAQEGSLELMVAFEKAAEARGIKAYFHEPGSLHF